MSDEQEKSFIGKCSTLLIRSLFHWKIFEGRFTHFQLEYFDDFWTFGILAYVLVNKISFLEQSGHFKFWGLLLAYYWLLAIVNALRF